MRKAMTLEKGGHHQAKSLGKVTWFRHDVQFIRNLDSRREIRDADEPGTPSLKTAAEKEGSPELDFVIC